MRKKKHPITLIEVMIVIVLIGIIGGALAYNMRGSLDKGKKFKSEQGAAQIENILLFAMAEDKEVNDQNWKEVVKASPLAKNPEKLIVDGWGKPYNVTVDGTNITVTYEQ